MISDKAIVRLVSILSLLSSGLMTTYCLAQGGAFVPLDRDNFVSVLATRATYEQLLAGRYNPVGGTPSTLEHELWLSRYCEYVVENNGYFTTRDWCNAVRDGFNQGARFGEMVAGGLPPRMPPSPEPFPPLDYTGCGNYYPAPSWFDTETPCWRVFPYYGITAEERATSEAQLRQFTHLEIRQDGYTNPRDIFNSDWLRQHPEFLEQNPMVQHLFNMWNVKIWQIPTRLDNPTCETCVLPVDGYIGSDRYLYVQRAWAQPENERVFFIFYFVIVEGGDIFRPGSVTHHVIRFGPPVTIWGQADNFASAYAQRILAAHGAVQSEPFLVQLYRATMFGDSFLKWYDRCHFYNEWSPDWRLTRDFAIDTLAWAALIGSFGCGTPARVALVIDSGFLVYETYDLICHPSWHTALKAGFRLLGVAGAGYYQYLQRKLPARPGDVADHIAPPDLYSVQSGCKPAQYREFIANQTNSSIYNLRGGHTIEETAEALRKMMKETQLDKINAMDAATIPSGAPKLWADPFPDQVLPHIDWRLYQITQETPALRNLFLDTAQSIVTQGRQHGNLIIADAIDRTGRRIGQRILQNNGNTDALMFRASEDVVLSLGSWLQQARNVLTRRLTSAQQVDELAHLSYVYSYTIPVVEGNAMYKNLLMDAIATFVNRGNKVTFDELLFARPWQYQRFEDYLPAFRELYRRAGGTL